MVPSPGSTQLGRGGDSAVEATSGQLRAEPAGSDVGATLRRVWVQVVLREGTDLASDLLRATKSASSFLQRAPGKSACAKGPSVQGHPGTPW